MLHYVVYVLIRLAAEQRMSKVAQDMEDQVSAHVEELQKVNDMLAKQKDLATKYSMKLMELEKERRLKSLTLKETQKELATEKAVSSKFYDEVNSVPNRLKKDKRIIHTYMCTSCLCRFKQRVVN